MVPRVLCSTGAFTGRVNGRNHRLAVEYASELACDGFEVMLFSNWYDFINEVVRDYQRAGLVCPVVHSDKRIGDWMSEPHDDSQSHCLTIWERNCRFAADIGAQKIVTHIWGIPDSDAYLDNISRRLADLLRVAERYHLDMVAENSFCVHGSPLEHFRELVKEYPRLGITLDTRAAQFHREADAFADSELLAKGNVRHWHISDYRGGFRDWQAMYPILQPGEGDVDFDHLFGRIKECHYAGTVTLEAPSIQAKGVDTETLNRSLLWLKDRVG